LKEEKKRMTKKLFSKNCFAQPDKINFVWGAALCHPWGDGVARAGAEAVG